jgi:hypothetical protein
MDSARFDMLTRLLANRASRRTSFAAAAAAALTPVLTSAQDATPVAVEASPVPDLSADFPVFLFVQTFTEGSWQPGGEDGLYTLTLSGVASGTIAFSDRPDRIVTLVPMQTFLNGLGFTPSNPPNAALVAMREGEDMSDQEVLVVELFSPEYDAAAGTLTYTARVLQDYGDSGLSGLAPNQTDSQFPESFAGGTLLIDDCSDGDAVCYQELNGEKVIVGNIHNVGCCYDWGAGNCEPCDTDARSQYYGDLCAETYPDTCTSDDSGWDCFVDAVACPIV